MTRTRRRGRNSEADSAGSSCSAARGDWSREILHFCCGVMDGTGAITEPPNCFILIKLKGSEQRIQLKHCHAHMWLFKRFSFRLDVNIAPSGSCWVWSAVDGVDDCASALKDAHTEMNSPLAEQNAPSGRTARLAAPHSSGARTEESALHPQYTEFSRPGSHFLTISPHLSKSHRGAGN